MSTLLPLPLRTVTTQKEASTQRTRSRLLTAIPAGKVGPGKLVWTRQLRATSAAEVAGTALSSAWPPSASPATARPKPSPSAEPASGVTSTPSTEATPAGRGTGSKGVGLLPSTPRSSPCCVASSAAAALPSCGNSSASSTPTPAGADTNCGVPGPANQNSSVAAPPTSPNSAWSTPATRSASVTCVAFRAPGLGSAAQVPTLAAAGE